LKIKISGTLLIKYIKMEVNELTEEQINEICMMMRVTDLLNSNPEIINSNPALKKESELISKKVKEIWDNLTEEQHNKVLEEFKKQMVHLADQEIKSKKFKF
jgi:hypothetical protein